MLHYTENFELLNYINATERAQIQIGIAHVIRTFKIRWLMLIDIGFDNKMQWHFLPRNFSVEDLDELFISGIEPIPMWHHVKQIKLRTVTFVYFRKVSP